MNNFSKSLLLTTCLLTALPQSVLGQENPEAENDPLKMAAIEALMVAPPEKALPVVQRVLAGDSSDVIKSRALFILGQIDKPEAQQTLLEFARSSEGNLQREAIRTIGISGNSDLTAQLTDIYANGSEEIRHAVLQAYMISGDSDSLLNIAKNAESDEEFEGAVRQLGVMGATEQLKQLRDYPGATESLIQAYAIAGDTESLTIMARDGSDRERQLAAIRGLGISGVGSDDTIFYDIYQETNDSEIREAVRHGMMVAGDDENALRLFRAATDDDDKAKLLRLLVLMDSDAAMEAIDEALGENPQ